MIRRASRSCPTWQRQSKQSGSIEHAGASPAPNANHESSQVPRYPAPALAEVVGTAPAPNANHESSQVPRYPAPALAEVVGTAKGTRRHFLSGPLTTHCSGRATGMLPLQVFFTAPSSRVTGGVIRPAIQTETPSCDVVGIRPRESIAPFVRLPALGIHIGKPKTPPT